MHPIAQMHESTVKTINTKIEHIKTRQSELSQLIADLDVNEQEIKTTKEEVIRQIRTFVEGMVDRLNKERREKLKQVDSNKQILKQELKKGGGK